MRGKEFIHRISVAAAFVICPGDEIAAVGAPIIGSAAHSAPHNAVLEENKPIKLFNAEIDHKKRQKPPRNHYKVPAGR